MHVFIQIACEIHICRVPMHYVFDTILSSTHYFAADTRKQINLQIKMSFYSTYIFMFEQMYVNQ